MGIPSFYKWLIERYPKTVVTAVEGTPLVINGVTIPIRTSDPNPNGIEFDNLYLDMNGIIHPCFHPEGLPAPSSYEEVFLGVFKYIDRIFSIVRPRKLLFMAIDGVAPRAKMNQQRSRRFRAAKDLADEEMMAERHQALESGGGTQDPVEKPKKLDSNVITPGTEFMDLLSSALRYYIHLRMNKDSGWRGIKVILSDATVPGEGEHKIMSYIRLQRNLPGFDSNTRHCLYGLDADLIMLALATHEVHFTILREDVRQANQSMEKLSAKKRKRKHGRHSLRMQKPSVNLETYISGLKFQLLNTWVLREYLALDMKAPDLTNETDLERLIDDFVFICLFVGNDFLPHIPSLEISEGAIDLLMTIYKMEFVKMGGYLTNSSEIHFCRVEHFVQAVGSHETAIFRKRMQIRKQQEAWIQTLSMHQRVGLPLKDCSIQSRSNALSSLNQAQQDINFNCDKIRLGEEGWKERYYKEKFEAKIEGEQDRKQRNAVLKYVEGITWVMRYYYVGVCSWQWFYPYHYAPFASDFCGIGQLEFDFTLGEPFKPFDQLMGVLPAASAHALPLFYRKLMTDTSSPILDLYPTDFELDMNGKRFSWQAICKLPFIEESRLLSEIAKVEHTLSDEERRRNSLGSDSLFVHLSHPLAKMIIAFFEDVQENLVEANAEKQIDPEVSGGMNGYICLTNTPVQPLDVSSPINGMPIVLQNNIISVLYKYPRFHPHITRIPEGVILPVKIVSKQEIPSQHRIWHEITNFRHISSRKPIKNAISGLRLAKCAHMLISKVIPPKLQADPRPGSEKLEDLNDRGLERSHGLNRKEKEIQSETRSKKMKKRKQKEYASMTNNNVLESEMSMEHTGIRPGKETLEDFNNKNFEKSHGLNGNQKEIKSETRTKKMKKRKRKEDISMTNNNVLESEMSMEHNGIKPGNEKLEDFNNKDFERSHRLNGNEKEIKSEKRIKKMKKRKWEEDFSMTNNNVVESEMSMEHTGIDKHATAGALNGNSVLKSKGSWGDGIDGSVVDDSYTSRFVEGLSSKNPEVQKVGHVVPTLSGQTFASGLENSKSILEPQKSGSDIPALSDPPVELMSELKSSKKRRVKEKRKSTANSLDTTALDGVQGVKSCTLEAQKVGDDTGIVSDQQEANVGEKAKKKRRAKENSKVQADTVVVADIKNYESSAFPDGVESLKSCSVEVQKAGDDARVVSSQQVEAKPVGRAKKNRPPKENIKVQDDTVAITDIKKFDNSAFWEDTVGTGDVAHVTLEGTTNVRTVPINGFQRLESSVFEEMKDDKIVPLCANGIGENKSKKKRKAKGGQNIVDIVTSVGPEKLEPSRSIPRESSDGGAIGAFEEVSSEIKSKKRKRSSKKMMDKPEGSLNDGQNLEPIHSMPRESGDGRAIGGLEETSSEIKSKKRKRSSNKMIKDKVEGIPNYGQNLESVNRN